MDWPRSTHVATGAAPWLSHRCTRARAMRTVQEGAQNVSHIHEAERMGRRPVGWPGRAVAVVWRHVGNDADRGAEDAVLGERPEGLVHRAVRAQNPDLLRLRLRRQQRLQRRVFQHMPESSGNSSSVVSTGSSGGHSAVHRMYHTTGRTSCCHSSACNAGECTGEDSPLRLSRAGAQERSRVSPGWPRERDAAVRQPFYLYAVVSAVGIASCNLGSEEAFARAFWALTRGAHSSMTHRMVWVHTQKSLAAPAA
eukprot:364682-Chlamydomonas_euryale.AAC.4